MSLKPEQANCVRCGDQLFGFATALCEECLEESSKEMRDAYEREDEEEEEEI